MFILKQIITQIAVSYMARAKIFQYWASGGIYHLHQCLHLHCTKNTSGDCDYDTVFKKNVQIVLYAPRAGEGKMVDKKTTK